MGITIVQKSDLKKKKTRSKKALILAGGAVTGGSFKAGGIKALNDYLTDFTVNDFDLYVGISSGSLLAAPLASGIKPEEILKSFDGTSKRFTELSPWHYYWPNLKEIVYRPISFWYRHLAKLPRVALAFFSSAPTAMLHFGKLMQALVSNPSASNYEALMSTVSSVVSDISLPSILQLLPSGVFDNSPIEQYLRKNIKLNHLTNSFQVAKKLTGKDLYISAMAVDGAKRVVFGHDESNDATISQAVQASTAMPGFYKPARINGVDYVDGGVQDTANIDIAIRKGAKLIICYNPFRPYDNKVLLEYIRKENKYVSKDRRLSDDGVMAILNQIFRAMFHNRLHVAIEQYRANPSFKGDIILIEPKADDAAFFGLNPLVFGNRIKAAALGYRSVRNSIDEKFPEVARILKSYGMTISRKEVEREINGMKEAGDSSAFLRAIMEDSVIHNSVVKKSTKPKKKQSRTKQKRARANA
jgi:predicted acylesterase/phospholipase RssA